MVLTHDAYISIVDLKYLLASEYCKRTKYLKVLLLHVIISLRNISILKQTEK